MTSYVTYQCSVCRRIKDSIKDNVRALPNLCTITKGCTGRLFKIGESDVARTVDPRSDLKDWYPRGQEQVIAPAQESESLVSLSTSVTGVLTLAIYQTDAEALSLDREKISVKFTQRRTEDISYQQYLFKPTTTTTLISGKDLTGKNLRFDQVMIDEGRVFVRVNGVARFPGNEDEDVVLTPNTVSFNSVVDALSTIDISVYTEKGTVSRSVEFIANRVISASASSGSWGNVRYLQKYNSDGTIQPNKWWLYSCQSHSELAPSSRLKLDTIYSASGLVILDGVELSNAMFLLASQPLQNIDRYLNFSVDCAQLNNFVLVTDSSTSKDVLVDSSVVGETWPPLQLKYDATLANSSFVTADVFQTDNSIQADTSLIRMKGSKILGPL